MGTVTHSPASAELVLIPSRGRSTQLQPKQQKQAEDTRDSTGTVGDKETGGFVLSLEQNPGGGGPGQRGPSPSRRPQVRLYPRAHLRPQPMELRAPPCPARPALTKPPERPQNTPDSTAPHPASKPGLSPKFSISKVKRVQVKHLQRVHFNFCPDCLILKTCLSIQKNI